MIKETGEEPEPSVEIQNVQASDDDVQVGSPDKVEKEEEEEQNPEETTKTVDSE